LAGVVALKRLPETKEAEQRWAKRIWERIQKLSESADPNPEQPAEGKSARKAKDSARVAKSAPMKTKPGKQAAPTTDQTTLCNERNVIAYWSKGISDLPCSRPK
jgi:hypothetical protein